MTTKNLEQENEVLKQKVKNLEKQLHALIRENDKNEEEHLVTEHQKQLAEELEKETEQ